MVASQNHSFQEQMIIRLLDQKAMLNGVQKPQMLYLLIPT